MSEKNFIYLTTTLPYVNAKPHIGHAKEFIGADVFARIYKLLGNEVFFNTGTDEHGAKIFEKAQEQGISPQEYCDGQSKHFLDFCRDFGINYTRFIRTTDKDHIAAAQDFWRICDKNGYIYKKKYQTKYCVGCELEKTDSELTDGKCPDHPNKEIQLIEEDNYFFKFSAFGQKLLDFYEQNPDFVKPKRRFNEIKNFVAQDLTDFSISRLKSKMPWGIEVPGDDEQVMYVWFDALVNYISTLGWPEESRNGRGNALCFTDKGTGQVNCHSRAGRNPVEGKDFNLSEKLKEITTLKKEKNNPSNSTSNWIPVFTGMTDKEAAKTEHAKLDLQYSTFWQKNEKRLQFCGKDNLRQQSAMWQAMLMAAEIPNSSKVYVNGFITVNGQKMSKTLGNVIDPFEMKAKFGAEATRYLLLSIGSFGEDTDITWKGLEEKYNADLANGLGNLVSRVITLYQKTEKKFYLGTKIYEDYILDYLKEGNLELILKKIWKKISVVDELLENKKPWNLLKTNKEEFDKQMEEFFVSALLIISYNLKPFMPETSTKIQKMLETKEKENLFPRV